MYTDYSNKRALHQWIKALLFGLALWVVIVLVMLFCAAGTVRQTPIGATTEIAIGPLTLMQAAKIARGAGGFTLSFTLQSGLVLLGVLCCAGEVLVLMAPRAIAGLHKRNRVRMREK